MGAKHILCQKCKCIPFLPVTCVRCDGFYCSLCTKDQNECLNAKCHSEKLVTHALGRLMGKVMDSIELTHKCNDETQTYTYVDLQKHLLESCSPHFTCPFADCPETGVKIFKPVLESHLKDECLELIVVCKFCEQSLPKKFYVNELKHNCLETMKT